MNSKCPTNICNCLSTTLPLHNTLTNSCHPPNKDLAPQTHRSDNLYNSKHPHAFMKHTKLHTLSNKATTPSMNRTQFIFQQWLLSIVLYLFGLFINEELKLSLWICAIIPQYIWINVQHTDHTHTSTFHAS